jgi:N-acetylglutamate synthase
MDAADDFYSLRGLPTRYQISSIDTELDQVLERRGFSKEAPTYVLTARADQVESQTTSYDHARVELAAQATDNWLQLWGEIFKLTDVGEQNIEILQRIGPAAVFGSVYENHEAVAVGMAVAERGWVGLFGCGTIPEKRRQGTGSHLVNALIGWAMGRESENVYLQVEEENLDAQSFYLALGFARMYSYHYRVKPSS